MLVAILALAVTACTSTQSTVNTRYYLVSGTTGEAIDRDMRRKGPMDGHAVAVAAIRFKPVSVLQEQTADGCRFTEALFKVDADITLPRWRQRATTGDRQLRRAWDRFADYARAHEQVHVRIAEQFAKRLGEEIAALPPQPDCNALDKSAERVVRRIGREHNTAQLAFDRAERARLERLVRETAANAPS